MTVDHTTPLAASVEVLKHVLIALPVNAQKLMQYGVYPSLTVIGTSIMLILFAVSSYSIEKS